VIGYVNCLLFFAVVGAPFYMVWHAFYRRDDDGNEK
jgi:hypothetical protein